MPVRTATLDDLPQLIDLAREYFDSIGRPCDLAAVANFLMQHLNSEHCAVFVAVGPDRTKVKGALSAVVWPQQFHAGAAAFKTGWCARPGAKGYGAALLRAFERWAKERGACRAVASSRQDRTARMLSKLGYHPMEAVCAKEL
jgi:hypothetical protein